MADMEWISEQELADTLKVDRSVLRQERPYLLAGEVEQKNGGVLWLRAAADRVSAKLGVAVPPPEKNAPQPPPDDAETLTVVRQAVNPNIVLARRADGSEVPVRVVDNKKYLPRCADGTPMTLKARKATAGAWWVLVGREPRRAGWW